MLHVPERRNTRFQFRVKGLGFSLGLEFSLGFRVGFMVMV
jgi:hypothetical protein